MIEKPPIGGKELLPLTSVQLAGFRLHPGPVRFHYSLFIRSFLALQRKKELPSLTVLFIVTGAI